MATTKRKQTDTAKAQIAAPVPGIRPNFTVLGITSDGQSIVIDRGRKARYKTFYEMYRQHPTVRAGVEKIAKVAVANGYRFVPTEAGDEIDEADAAALREFFRKSNGSQLLRLTYKDLLIYGEAFWLVIRNGADKPLNAMRLHPQYIDHKLDNGVLVGWRYGPIGDSDEAKKYSREEVVQFKFDDPDNDIRGLSLLASLELTVASDLFAMQFNERFFENSAHTGIIFSMKNSNKDEVERNREWMIQNYQGNQNAHKPLLLEGDIEVSKSVSTRQEMQFIEGRKFNRQEILSVLDIDPSKLGITEDSNRSTSKEADNTFRQENVAPLQLVVEEEINNHLIMRLFGTDEILFRQNDSSRRDLLEMMKLYAEAERMGIMSINQIKGELGLPKVDGGDVHFVQTAAGAIPVEWLDDVAQRLISPTGLPMSGSGTANQPPSAVPEDIEDDSGAAPSTSEGTGGTDHTDG